MSARFRASPDHGKPMHRDGRGWWVAPSPDRWGWRPTRRRNGRHRLRLIRSGAAGLQPGVGVRVSPGDQIAGQTGGSSVPRYVDPNG